MRQYMEEFTERCEALANTKLADCPPLAERKNQVEEMIESYYSYVGQMPKNYALEKLGDYLLIKELKDKDVDKVTNNEFPILSEIQLKRRARKQMLMQDQTIDFLNTKFNQNIDSLAKKAVKKVEY